MAAALDNSFSQKFSDLSIQSCHGHQPHGASSMTRNDSTFDQVSVNTSQSINCSQQSQSLGGFQQHDVSDDHFQRLELLGRGAYAVVYLAIHKPSGMRVALKEINRDLIRQKKLQKLLKSEINVHRALRHPHVVRLYTYYVTAETVTLVLEACEGGTLHDLVKSEGPLDEVITSRCIRQCAKALKYLHEKNIIHRDLKLENILVNSTQDNFKVADFGCSREMKQEEGGSSRSTFCGTLDYLSPEMIQTQNPTTQADVWALGVMAIELMMGEPPFYDESKDGTFFAIKNSSPKFPAGLSEIGKSLLLSMLEKAPEKRPTMAELLSHPWLQQSRLLAPRSLNVSNTSSHNDSFRK